MVRRWIKVTVFAKSNSGKLRVVQFLISKSTGWYTRRITKAEIEDAVKTMLEEKNLTQEGVVDALSVDTLQAHYLRLMGWQVNQIQNVA